jgi:hypothetical protein
MMKKDNELHYKDMPKDAVKLKTVVDYDLLISKQEKCVYFYPTAYHVETLCLTEETLNELIQGLK